MLFRIDHEHFLTHMIDHFTREDILGMEFAILSGGIQNLSKASNMAKINELYPEPELVLKYKKYEDKDIFRKEYLDHIKTQNSFIYRVFINPILQHKNIVIICKDEENLYVDVLVEYLKDKFKLECIDLNELFIKGRVGPISFDRDLIYNKAVAIRREAGKDMLDALATSRDGRMKLLSKMNKETKILKLKELGIKVSKSDYRNLDQLLIDSWVEQDD